MARKRKPAAQLITTSLYEPQSDELYLEPPARRGTWKFLLLILLVAALAVSQLLVGGT